MARFTFEDYKNAASVAIAVVYIGTLGYQAQQQASRERQYKEAARWTDGAKARFNEMSRHMRVGGASKETVEQACAMAKNVIEFEARDALGDNYYTVDFIKELHIYIDKTKDTYI